MTPLWYELSFRADDAEEKSYVLFEHGVMGANFPDAHTVVCYAAQPEAVVSAASEAGFVHISTKEVEAQNWNTACVELWQPITIGNILVSPVATLEEGLERPLKQNELRIIPGLGFGTGHHMATRLALEFLQLPIEAPERVLDLGCGSGILAIAAALLFPRAEIEAVDIDALALENAKDNITLNPSAQRIMLREGSINVVAGDFDVVVANIYAEILVSIESQLFDVVKLSGHIILSGIMESLAGHIRSAFSPKRWRSVQSIERESWSAFVFQKL